MNEKVEKASQMIKYYIDNILKSTMSHRHCSIFCSPIDKGWKITIDSSTYYTINNDIEVKFFIHDRGLGGDSIRIMEFEAKQVNNNINVNGWAASHEKAINILIDRYNASSGEVKQVKKKVTRKQKKIEEALGKIDKLKEQDALSKLKFWERPKK